MFEIVKYITIIILSIGLYFTWLQKDKFEANSLYLKEKNQKLKEKIQTLKEDLEKKYSQNCTHTESINQPIKIILPKYKKVYEDVIPTVSYKDLDFKKTKDEIKEDVKIIPNISFGNDKEINKVEIKIQTKF